MLPYILKICGFRNSIVYTFYGMYEKYTFFIKLYIYGLTYRLYVRLKHKLRIDVITYIPTMANGPLNIPTSAGYPFYDIYCCAGTVYFALVVVDPPWICGMG